MADPTTSEELDFSHYLDVILRRRWVVVAAFTMVFVSTALVTFTTRRVYQATSLLVIEKERGGGVIQNGSMVENSNEDYYQTQYKLLQSRSLLEKVYADLKLGETEDFKNPRGIHKLQSAVSIAPVIRSRLVNVRVESHDPKLAASIANRLSESFVEQNLASQLFISKEVLQALQAKGGDSNAADLPAVVNNALIQTLKGDYSKLQSTYAELYARYTDKHPAVIRVKSSMIALDAQIRAETARIVSSMKTELSGQLKGNNVRIIDVALIPETPIKPKRRTALVLGFLGGLAVGFGLAFLVEMLDQSVRTQEDVENKLNLPFLGQIPLSADTAGGVYKALLSKELSLTSEAVRNLRTMVDFAAMPQNIKIIMVTSTVQDEGKSYVASNLAVAFSQLGEKILLITGDLRRPSIHKNFGISTERGLSDFLAKGRNVDELAELMQESAVPGVTILACGPRPPNPSELLNTPRLAALIAWAKANYDRVIVDCTPMFPIHDTLLWGRHVNAAVFVVRYGSTRAPLVVKACQRLQEGGVKILGAVVNAARPGGLTYSSYGYYYQQYHESYQHEEVAGKAS